MIHAVILAGGWGERLWPMSTRERPKQLLELGGDKTLVAATLERVAPIAPPETSLVITSEALRDVLADELRTVPRERVIGEPVGRNTAPAIAMAAHVLLAEDPNALMIVLPADHVIRDVAGFRDSVGLAVDAAESDRALVTLGVKPDRPEPEYGYIRIGGAAGEDVFVVESFVEKPDQETASRYVEEGSYVWNSGMFIWRADRVLEEVERQLPDLSKALRHLGDSPAADGFRDGLSRFYDEAPAVSIDYGIMEGARGVLVVPAAFDWDDIGAWTALPRLWGVDAEGNATCGETVLLDSTDSVVYAEEGVVALLGVTGVVVARTPGGTLVCPKERAADVRRIVDELKRRRLADNG